MPALVWLLVGCLGSVVQQSGTASGPALAPAATTAPRSTSDVPDDLSAFIGRRVTSVALVEEGKPAPDELNSLVAVKNGAPLALEAIRSSIQALVTAGHMDSADVVASTRPDGSVDLVFNLVPHRPIGSLSFQGDTGLSPEVLQARVKQQYGGEPVAVPPTSVAKAVASLLRDEGFLDASATASVGAGETPDRASLIISIHAGPRAMIAKLDVTGTSPISEDEILKETGAVKGEPYLRGHIEAALLRIRERLRGDKYYEADATISDDAGTPDGKSVTLVLDVNAGPLVLGPFFTGDPPPSGSLDDLVPMKVEQSDDNDLLDDANARIMALLQKDGYLDATAQYTKTSTPEGLRVTFDIHRGPLYRISNLQLPPHPGLSQDAFNKALGISKGDPFSRAQLQLGVDRLSAEYQQQGFYQVGVAATPKPDGQPVDGHASESVTVALTEGPRAHVADIVFQPIQPKVPLADLEARMAGKVGKPYIVADAARDETALESLYHDRGFPDTHVTITPTPGADGRAITLTVAIDEGRQVFVQDIQVIGNRRVATQTIRDAMALKPGQPLGNAALVRTRQNIQELSGFRSVEITEQPVVGDPSRVHLIVTVTESPATAIVYGGGLLIDRLLVPNAANVSEERLDVGPRGTFDITRQNLGGLNRSLDFSVSIGIRSNPNTPTNSFDFLDDQVSLSYKERRAFHTNTDLTFSATTDRDVQTDFNFVEDALKANALHHVSRRLSVDGQYALVFTSLFNQSIPSDEQLQIDRLFPQVRLSTLSTDVNWDRRNDPITPSSGTLFGANFEAAPRSLGSQVGFVKTLLQGSVYRALDRSRRFIAAGRVEIGLAHGFEEEEFTDPEGNPVLNPSTGLPVFVAELPASERFYAGGANTVRGFNEGVIGVPLIIENDGLSLGGNGMVVMNLELRTRLFPVYGRDFGIVTFTDSGNVFLNASDINFGQLRGTVGFGFRYNSPLGPIRLDYGFKLTRLPFGTSGVLEPGWTWHLSVGEAF